MQADSPRPSATPPPYRDAYCARVVEFMGQGYSLTAFAGEIGASRADLERWREAHTPFAAAVARGQARRARVLEDRLLAAKGSGAFGAHMEALKTAAPDEWTGKGPRAKPRQAPPPAAALDLPDNGRG